MPSRESAFGLILVAGLACQSMPARESLSLEDAALTRADSEVFAAVIRPQLEPGVDSVLYGGASLRVDSRPYGEGVRFRDVAGGGTGLGSRELFQVPDSAMMRRLTANRKRILASNGLKEGSAFSYPKCGGTLAPPPPPPPSGSAQPTSANRSSSRDGCPPTDENYVNVGVPVRGVPESLKKLQSPARKPVDITGDFWTVIVNDYHAGPSGQNWFQYAIVLRRDPQTARLRAAAKRLLSWAE